jgi:hypothetical protein
MILTPIRVPISPATISFTRSVYFLTSTQAFPHTCSLISKDTFGCIIPTYPPAKGFAHLVDKNALALLISVVVITSVEATVARDVADPA